MSPIKSNRFYHSSIVYFILIIILSVSFVFLYYYSQNLLTDKSIADNFQREISRQITNLEEKYNSISGQIKNGDDGLWQDQESRSVDDEFMTLIYQKDSLIFWNNNIISGDFANIGLKKICIISDKSGWYLVYNKIQGVYRVIICKQLGTKYSNGQNITTNISGGLVSCENFHLTLDKSQSEYSIYDNEKKFLVGIFFSGESHLSLKANLILFLIFIIDYLLVLILVGKLYKFIRKRINKPVLLYVSLLADYIIIRVLEFSFGFPAILKGSSIFQQKFDIFPLFNSPGDLIINALILLCISVYLLRLPVRPKTNDKSETNYISLIMSFISTIYTVFVFYLVNKVIQQLPYNSFFGFSISGTNTILILGALLILISSLFIFHHAFVKYILPDAGKLLYLILLWVVVIILCLYLLLPLSWFVALVSGMFMILIMLAYFFLSTTKKLSFYKYLVLIIIYALSTSLLLNQARLKKKDLYQITTLKVLSDPHDLQLENNFATYKKEIINDSTVNHLLLDNSFNYKTNLENYLKKTYFSDLAEKYTIQITICRPGDMLELKPEDIVVNCSSYFDDMMNSPGNDGIDSTLVLIPGDPESIYYLGKTSIKIGNELVSIFIEFFFTYVPEGLGYPELLINKSAYDIDLSDYSFALYSDGQLTNKFGEYKYLTSFTPLKHFPADQLFDLNNYRHIIHKLSPGNYLIISRPKDRISVQLVTFSVLFVIYVLTLAIIVLLLFGRETKNLIRLSFQSRLQVIFLSTISLIIILLATITLFYANVDNKNRLVYQLNEKTNSVIIELQHKLSDDESFFKIDPTELEFLLKKFSMVFFSDINLYSPSGELISTSRPEIFEKGLLSDRINPRAFDEIFFKDQLFFVLKEKIGKTSYYSSYAPVDLGGNQIAGIINLPYFAKQSEVNRSYYLMIFTFFDLFVILGIVGSIIAILSSRIITRPLSVLQAKLSGIQIDKRNEIIEWKTKDEIGQLIEAYNDMIEKLEASTELLKQSERESAWREVAQQIAHEIKNPLTPMKLNIQYLEKAFQDKDPQLDEKVKNISGLLINQIETLNKVAEMFADFAKTNKGKFVKVDILKAVNEAVQLYKNHSNVHFELETDGLKNYYTRAIEKDLVRVFNNLIKNAIQSIEGLENGKITIKFKSAASFYLVDITDNGKGIPDQLKANIFQPYFTTKSKGTGLGLAIVKNIITELGGEIAFESKPETGTTFNLKFPVFKE